MQGISGVFEMFKVGVGPSSSHTMGPMVAARRFLDLLRDRIASVDALPEIKLSCTLYGSLALTGKGHATDRAVILGLSGMQPDDIDPAEASRKEAEVRQLGRIALAGLPSLEFSPERDLIFSTTEALPLHPNGMSFTAFNSDGSVLLQQSYYSIGGGFVSTKAELTEPDACEESCASIPYPFETASELLDICQRSELSIAEVMRSNELACIGEAELATGLSRIWQVMSACIEAGLLADGILPGGLQTPRRARSLYKSEQCEPYNFGLGSRGREIAAYALAVNEQNAAGAQVVTAPTNGAAGVIPAVLRGYLDEAGEAGHARIELFLLTAAAIGGIIKRNASISGAEMGCQGEVGSAAAMAAAELCAALGGTPWQVENAAEIALEHHLGMTCDPVRGLVQVPCIERNAMGAIKAVLAATLALNGDGTHLVSLDACIETMRQIGRDMDAKYRETSRGGLAVNVPEC